jgi:hypothetical protein
MLSRVYTVQYIIRMRNKSGREYNCCCVLLIWDTGDRGLFVFQLFRSLFFDVFPFPCTDNLFGNFHVIRRCAPNWYIHFIMRHYKIGRTIPVRHVTGNDQDYLRKIPRVVVQKSALL